MSRKGALCWALVVFGLVMSWSAWAAAAPWEKLLTLNRVEADPNKSYTLTKENGPWMILACTFSGEDAKRQATDLVLELRKRYKVPAYAYEKKFDFDDENLGRGLDQLGGSKKMRYQRGGEIREIGVMVGDFPAIDDPKAQKMLQEVKSASPECLEIKEGKKTNQSLAALRYIQREIHSAMGSDKKKKGPMGHAFLTTNPLLPKDYFAPKGIDKLVLAMNEGNKFSLLDCPGKYTVQVAHFTGSVLIDQKKIRQVEDGQLKMKNGLVAAGEKAEAMAEALRQKGYEAYVLHDRYASLVTVGGFESVGTPLSDGRIDLNPQIHTIMKTFGAEQVAGGGYQPKDINGIPFDIQPIPVQVPKRSISADYNREPLRMN
jgi:hypothetical protein